MRYNSDMEYFWYTIVFVWGAIIGSFLNVVIYRMHTGRSLNGRSHCMSCGTLLTWYELFPVASYLFLRAKCRYCTSYIPSRYLFVEVLTGISFVLLFNLYSYNMILFVIHAVLVATLIVIAVYDVRHTIIPDELTILVGITALILVGYEYVQTGIYEDIIFAGVSGVCVFLFFAGLWKISHGRWIGFGDAKLALPLGIVVGGDGVFSMIVFSFWIGAIISVCLLALQRLFKRGKNVLPFLSFPLTIKSAVPFAPFLILGFLCVHLFHANVYDIIFTFFPL